MRIASLLSSSVGRGGRGMTVEMGLRGRQSCPRILKLEFGRVWWS